MTRLILRYRCSHCERLVEDTKTYETTAHVLEYLNFWQSLDYDWAQCPHCGFYTKHRPVAYNIED